jgi:cellulose synthase/poly-beta-1,6-N-acetylglucosamine synthase-like glycosyltransferase
MAEIANACAWVVLAVLTLQVIWFTVQVLAGPGSLADAALPPPTRARLAILMPAHNEAEGIEPALRAVQRQLQPGDRIIVVADNCVDRTAAIARQCGVAVIERSDDAHRGKGFALAFGIDHLRADPPEIVIFLDADCILAPRALDWLKYVCTSTDRPTQSAYLMYANENSPPARKVAQFAWAVKNWLRPLGAWRLGLPCPLYGSGMALPWRLAASAPLATAHLVEDLKLGLDLALAGELPLFCPESLVTSAFPDNTAGASVQRTRWEHGHLGLILMYVPKLTRQALRTRNLRLLTLALDVSIPPLSLLILIAISSTTIGAGALLFGLDPTPWRGLIAVSGLLFAAIYVAWYKAGRSIVQARHVYFAVHYVFSKIPLYVRFLMKRQTEWVRSERDKS